MVLSERRSVKLDQTGTPVASCQVLNGMSWEVKAKKGETSGTNEQVDDPTGQ